MDKQNGDQDRYRSLYAIRSRYRYPLDTEKNTKKAMKYFSRPVNRGRYSQREQKIIVKKILSATKKYGIPISENIRNRFNIKKSDKKLLIDELVKSIFIICQKDKSITARDVVKYFCNYYIKENK